MRVEDSDIQERSLKAAAPEAINSNIQSRTIGPDRGSSSQNFSREWPQVRLTSWQTSVSIVAVTSRISLWRMIGKPPLGHERTCSTVNEEPHTQWRGMLEGNQPYRSARASLNAPLCKQKPNSSMGREVSQFEAPFSLASSMARLLEVERWAFRSSTASEACSCSSFCTAVLAVL